jgi:hypothetical protein
MKHFILIVFAALAACGGGTDPCSLPNWRDAPECVPPVPLPCTYPCSDGQAPEGNHG